MGASVVNALSEWLEVTIYREGKKYKQRFADGGKPASPLTEQGKQPKRNRHHFKPDPAIFHQPFTNLKRYQNV